MGGAPQVKPSFACESTPYKRKFIVKNAFAGLPDACVFTDMADLHKPVAKCYAHGPDGPCSPQACDIFWCGFSCKPFSKLTSQAKNNKSLLSLSLLEEVSLA